MSPIIKFFSLSTPIHGVFLFAIPLAVFIFDSAPHKTALLVYLISNFLWFILFKLLLIRKTGIKKLGVFCGFLFLASFPHVMYLLPLEKLAATNTSDQNFLYGVVVMISIMLALALGIMGYGALVLHLWNNFRKKYGTGNLMFYKLLFLPVGIWFMKNDIKQMFDSPIDNQDYRTR